MSKIRLDQLLVERGLETSRERAKARIMEGAVFVNGEKMVKPGDSVAPDVQLTVRGDPIPYVSRGGLKLAKAMQCFPIELKDKICMDVGASTGGVTDCMLQNGAARVYSVDVGYGQLAWKLRTDPRVVSLERTNVRYLTADQVPEPIGFFSVDISFISLTLALPVIHGLLRADAEGVCLIKPQFEAGREHVGKKGVVRDPAVHAAVIRKIVDFASGCGLGVAGLDYSPVKGPEGNIEYLLYVKTSCQTDPKMIKIEEVVETSHNRLNRPEGGC